MKLRVLITQFITIIILSLLFGCYEENDKIKVGHYFINSQTGIDDNSGTSKDTPWKSLKNLETRIFLPGDTICFAKGSSYTGGATLKGSGTIVQPVVITSYGTGDEPKFSNPSNDIVYGNVFRILGKHFVIENSYFSNCGFGSGPAPGVFDAGAIFFTAGADSGIVRNCEFTDVGFGVQTYAKHTLITHNSFHDCNRTMLGSEWGPIGVAIGASYNEVSYNNFKNIISMGGRFGADGGAIEILNPNTPKEYIFIHHNRSYGCEGFLEDTYEGTDKPPLSEHFTIAYNISEDYQSFVFFWGTSNSLICNNTVIKTLPKNSVTDVVFTFKQGKVNTIINNIFVIGKDAITGSIRKVYSTNATETWGAGYGDWYSGQIRKNNLYYCFDGSTTEPVNLPLAEGEKVGDPRFVDWTNRDLHLTSGSPAKDAGLASPYSIDFDGNLVPIGITPDMGVYEFK